MQNRDQVDGGAIPRPGREPTAAKGASARSHMYTVRIELRAVFALKKERPVFVVAGALFVCGWVFQSHGPGWRMEARYYVAPRLLCGLPAVSEVYTDCFAAWLDSVRVYNIDNL